jgi:plastocyanin
VRRARRKRRSRLLSVALAVAGLLALGGWTAEAAQNELAAAPAAPSGPDAPAAAVPAYSVPQAPVNVRASASATKSVSIVDFDYDPRSLTVHAGDTVQWTNDGQVPEGHTVTGDGLDSGVLHSGASYSFTFKSSGTFSYICTLHPNMKGSVHVLAATSSSGGSGGSGSNPSNGSSGSGGGGSSSGSSGGSTTSTTGSGSESAAVASADAAGSDSSLPATGSDSLAEAMIGLLLAAAGVTLRRLLT